jgi:hypothetical protein
MMRSFRCPIVCTIMATFAACVAGCGSDSNPTTPPPPVPGVVKVTVKSSADNLAVSGSNVVLYRADTNEAVLRALTGLDGIAWFCVDEANYYLNVSAQGFNPVPRENIMPIPFFVTWDDTLEQNMMLDALETTDNIGFVVGAVSPGYDNFLILAESQATRDKYYTASGPDGFFVLFNLPYGTYDLDALKAGFKMDAPVTATISSSAEVDTVSVPVSVYQGSLLSGSVTFLASQNAAVDITLLDPETRAVIPGLTVRSQETGLTYSIDGIPDGEYLAWASLENDGYVIDPDWLFKNPGGLDIAFLTAQNRELDFSVTDAITLVSPTNPAGATIPVMANSQQPTFTWTPYPSAQEYFIEVRDFGGEAIWGGINADGTVNHGYIGANTSSVVFNFDNQLVDVLQPGEVYQWRLWADKGTQADSFVEQLISSSEDLRGIFLVPDNPTE